TEFFQYPHPLLPYVACRGIDVGMSERRPGEAQGALPVTALPCQLSSFHLPTALLALLHKSVQEVRWWHQRPSIDIPLDATACIVCTVCQDGILRRKQTQSLVVTSLAQSIDNGSRALQFDQQLVGGANHGAQQVPINLGDRVGPVVHGFMGSFVATIL